MQFNSIQQGLAFAFQGFRFNTYNLGHPDDPCFATPELVPIFGARDGYNLTRYLDRDEVITISIKEVPSITEGAIVPSITEGANLSMIRHISFITLPGLFSLIAIMGRRNPNIHEFDRYIRHDVLPTLYYNPQLVEQINELAAQRDEARSMATSYHDESADLRRRYNYMIGLFNTAMSVLDNIDSIRNGKFDFNEFRRSMTGYNETNPKIEMCHLRNPKGNRFFDNN